MVELSYTDVCLLLWFCFRYMEDVELSDAEHRMLKALSSVLAVGLVSDEKRVDL